MSPDVRAFFDAWMARTDVAAILTDALRAEHEHMRATGHHLVRLDGRLWWERDPFLWRFPKP